MDVGNDGPRMESESDLHSPFIGSPTVYTPTSTEPEDALLRSSLMDQSAKFRLREMYAGLKLSGNVISAAFCIPFKVSLNAKGEWVSPKSTGSTVAH